MIISLINPGLRKRIENHSFCSEQNIYFNVPFLVFQPRKWLNSLPRTEAMFRINIMQYSRFGKLPASCICIDKDLSTHKIIQFYCALTYSSEMAHNHSPEVVLIKKKKAMLHIIDRVSKFGD